MDIKVDKNTVIVFDLDDTLYNELDYLISAYKNISKYIDESDSKRIFSIMFSLYRNNLNVFEYLSKNYSVKKDDLIEIYRNHNPNIKLNKGVKKILKSIKNKNGKIGIITDGRSITQRNKIKALRIDNYLDYISISEEIEAEKPSSIPFVLTMNQVSGDKYFYIADNLKKDFISPNNLNWTTICVLDNGKNIHKDSYLYQKKEFMPDFMIYEMKNINIK